MLRAKKLIGLVVGFFYVRASIVSLKIRLTRSFSTLVTLSNVIRLVCQDFISPHSFLHEISQSSGMLNNFSLNWKTLFLPIPLDYFPKVWCTVSSQFSLQSKSVIQTKFLLKTK